MAKLKEGQLRAGELMNQAIDCALFGNCVDKNKPLVSLEFNVRGKILAKYKNKFPGIYEYMYKRVIINFTRAVEQTYAKILIDGEVANLDGSSSKNLFHGEVNLTNYIKSIEYLVDGETQEDFINDITTELANALDSYIDENINGASVFGDFVNYMAKTSIEQDYVSFILKKCDDQEYDDHLCDNELIDRLFLWAGAICKDEKVIPVTPGTSEEPEIEIEEPQDQKNSTNVKKEEESIAFGDRVAKAFIIDLINNAVLSANTNIYLFVLKSKSKPANAIIITISIIHDVLGSTYVITSISDNDLIRDKLSIDRLNDIVSCLDNKFSSDVKFELLSQTNVYRSVKAVAEMMKIISSGNEDDIYLEGISMPNDNESEGKEEKKDV